MPPLPPPEPGETAADYVRRATGVGGVPILTPAPRLHERAEKIGKWISAVGGAIAVLWAAGSYAINSVTGAVNAARDSMLASVVTKKDLDEAKQAIVVETVQKVYHLASGAKDLRVTCPQFAVRGRPLLCELQLPELKPPEQWSK